MIGRRIVGALLLVVTACGSDAPAPLVGYERTPTPNVGSLSLPSIEPDGTETDVELRASEGDLMLVYLGYTSCPDVCPTTLSDIRLALKELGDDATRVQLAMVTIDPEVDTPDVLVAYVRSFEPTAMALRTVDDVRLREVADGFGADYGTEDVDGEPEVFHTGSIYAVDSAGDVALTWPFGVSPEDLASDLGQLLERDA